MDFSAQDWKERERDRDRLEAYQEGGPGPSTAISRAKDKRGEQTPHNIFQAYADTWFRTITEDDLAWLAPKVSLCERCRPSVAG